MKLYACLRKPEGISDRSLKTECGRTKKSLPTQIFLKIGLKLLGAQVRQWHKRFRPYTDDTEKDFILKGVIEIVF